METVSALGGIGFALILTLSLLLLCVQPLWAIIDCLDSPRDRDAKILVSLAILLTWTLGGVLYGAFFPRSSTLRRFTLGLMLVLFLLAVTAVGACTVGGVRAAEQARIEQAQAQKRATEALHRFRPAAIAPDAVAPFDALHFTRGDSRWATSIAEFTLAGPDFETARDASDQIRQVAAAGEAIFAITTHEFGMVSPSSGRFLAIALEPGLEERFAWPKGLAFVPGAEQLIVMTSHVGSRFYRYHPKSAAWEELPAEHSGASLVALAWLPETKTLYALEREQRDELLTTLQRFNERGAHLGALALQPPIPLSPDQDDTGFQLHASSGLLVLLVPPTPKSAGPPRSQPTRIYAIDAESGVVSAPQAPTGS